MAKVPAFRIAMRTAKDAEGNEWWVALLARIEHMDDTLEIARIRRSAANDEAVRGRFIEFCQFLMTRHLSMLGVKPSDWQVQKPMPPSKGSG